MPIISNDPEVQTIKGVFAYNLYNFAKFRHIKLNLDDTELVNRDQIIETQK